MVTDSGNGFLPMNRRDFIKSTAKAGAVVVVGAVVPELVIRKQATSNLSDIMFPANKNWGDITPTPNNEYSQTFTVDQKETIKEMSDLNFDQVVEVAIEAIKESRSIVVKQYG